MAATRPPAGCASRPSRRKEGTLRWLRVIGRKEINETIAGLPLIHADATLQFELVHHYLPNLQLALDLEVEAPHMQVTQVIGLPVGKASLQALPAGKRSAEKEARVGRKRQRLVDVVRHLSRPPRPGHNLQGHRGRFRQIEGVEVAHFNAIEGIDRWRNVDVARDHRPAAAKAAGHRAPGGSAHRQARHCGRHDRAGPPDPARQRCRDVLKCRVYAAPEAELIRQAVTEAAVVQAVGRVRGVNRTAANPVEVFMILHDTVTALPVDEVVEFADLEPDAIDEMVARGLVPQFGSDAAKLYPDLFPSAAAAKRAYRLRQLNVERGTRRRGPGQGRRRETTPYREDIYKGMSLCSRSPLPAFGPPRSTSGSRWSIRPRSLTPGQCWRPSLASWCCSSGFRSRVPGLDLGTVPQGETAARSAGRACESWWLGLR